MVVANPAEPIVTEDQGLAEPTQGMCNAEDIKRTLERVRIYVGMEGTGTHDDVLGGKCTVFRVTLLRKWSAEVRINVREQYSGRVKILEKQEDEGEFV